MNHYLGSSRRFSLQSEIRLRGYPEQRTVTTYELAWVQRMSKGWTAESKKKEPWKWMWDGERWKDEKSHVGCVSPPGTLSVDQVPLRLLMALPDRLKDSDKLTATFRNIFVAHKIDHRALTTCERALSRRNRKQVVSCLSTYDEGLVQFAVVWLGDKAFRRRRWRVASNFYHRDFEGEATTELLFRRVVTMIKVQGLNSKSMDEVERFEKRNEVSPSLLAGLRSRVCDALEGQRRFDFLGHEGRRLIVKISRREGDCRLGQLVEFWRNARPHLNRMPSLQLRGDLGLALGLLDQGKIRRGQEGLRSCLSRNPSKVRWIAQRTLEWIKSRPAVGRSAVTVLRQAKLWREKDQKEWVRLRADLESGSVASETVALGLFRSFGTIDPTAWITLRPLEDLRSRVKRSSAGLSKKDL